MARSTMETADLRIALFSGNYNYVRDGANQALNRLSEYLLRQGAKVRVYSPVVASPAFEPTGDLVGVCSLPIPSRSEYRIPLLLAGRTKKDLKAFAPNVVHVSSPDPVGHQAVTWARNRDLPVLASVHTRFETYLRYYNMAWGEPVVEAVLRRFYRRCDALVAPSESMAQLLRDQRMNYDISIWSRGVDRDIFHAGRRDLEWRRSHGVADDEVAIGFLGRLVMEKGLDVFSDTLDDLRRRGVKYKALVVGEGPAREWFEARLPGAAFVGFQQGADLGRAVACMDVLFNPSVTETFGNVTLEAMACGLPAVVSDASPGPCELIGTDESRAGLIVPVEDAGATADAILRLARDETLRRRFGLAARERVRAHDADHAIDVWLRLLRCE